MASEQSAALTQLAEDSPASAVNTAARFLRAKDQPFRLAFAQRVVNAVLDLTDDLDDRCLADLVSSPSNLDALLRALSTPEAQVVLRAHDPDPLAPARLRGLHAREQLLSAEGGMLGVDEVARTLDLTRQGVDKRRRAGRLLAISTGRHGYQYPAWQFTATGVLPGLEPVLEALSGHDAWMQLVFFVSGNVRLNNESPLAELRRGHLEEVVQAAGAYGEHGAA